MPASDAGSFDRQEVDERQDKGGKSGKSKGSKSKDLSHVPCKFFKVGGCTAGASCPFSHHTLEPGHQKDVCAWFIKGQCKFGHKCALAHILPGQPMSMDRKNKKAAQAAQAGSGQQVLGPNTGGAGRGQGQGQQQQKDERTRKRRSQVKETPAEGMGTVTPNPDIGEPIVLPSTTGSSPPGPMIRVRQPTGYAKMSSPVTITASMPAPPVRDTDFPFGIPDDMPKTIPSNPPPAPMTIPSPTKSNLPPRLQAQRRLSASASAEPPLRSPPGFDAPMSTPHRPAALNMPAPITRTDSGSLISPTRAKRISGDYGFGPIGSPSRASFTQGNAVSPPMHNGVHRAEGLSPGISPGTSPHGNNFLSSSPFGGPGTKGLFMSYSVGDSRDPGGHAGLGFATPDRSALNSIRETGRRGSLDLLNGEAVAGDDEELEEFLPSSLSELLTPGERERRKSRTGGVRPSLEAHHQRFAQSVPAASTLDNVKGLWRDVSTASSPGLPPMNSGPLHHPEDQISPSLLSTSNASAAFLTHAHAHRPSINTLRSFDTQLLGSSQFPSTKDPIAGPSHRSRAARASLDATLRLPQMRPGGFGMLDDPGSPSALALQEHAPGKSLPQGVGAGLSRLHLVPSKQTPSPFGSPNGFNGFDAWQDTNSRLPLSGQATRPGLSPPYSRSGSFRDSIQIPSGSPGLSGLGSMGSGAMRRARGGGMLSPLARPVGGNNDDIDDHMFPMDG